MSTKEKNIETNQEHIEEVELNSFDEKRAEAIMDKYIKADKAEKKHKALKSDAEKELSAYLESTGMKEFSHDGKDAKFVSKKDNKVNTRKLLELKGKFNKRGQLVIDEDELNDLIYMLDVGKTKAVELLGKSKVESIEDKFNKPEKMYITKSKKGD